MSEQKHTFCRVCEPSCALIATVSDGELISLKPDREHPVTKGFACHKGLATLDLHKDPDRLNYPQRKLGEAFERISWDEAGRDIAARLADIKARYGNDAVAPVSALSIREKTSRSRALVRLSRFTPIPMCT